ncbi:MAG: ATP-binding cassette domain-containing protein [Cellulomonas sp.]|uniref:ABC transporter n=1 Tax=Cellulomonas gelida TaxID=1712 RepID=A0A4Y3KMS2_9CELL|nr:MULTISPECIES: ATP-binding cassette domain-containing protein [Cellulomonas]KMM46000.1 ABC transporter [Cellulomonas sp. A375-1]MCR6648998.1 ATP-binding cassette domain-containing protein [Cellulomonas sp.]MCR6704986.1 ATP-binding cassette domain-containing protein [Cellulomonas sp.]GEA85709.1 ABC transporter [Cellulomonas gelida]GGL39098.1 ABC transporter [Cellulomonas gelida]
MIEVEHVTKTYRGRRVLTDVDLTCVPGTITGFLGPNGAGKSTTMRIVVGLTRPDSGTARVCGTPFRELRNPGRVVGIQLDSRALASARTGRENLLLAARTMGLAQVDLDEVLGRVGLAGHGDRRVADYSLGMRQRLGIAQALLGEPEVLILDEPANGLDPAGIVWMRTILRRFADDGGTVLLSSHLLHEVERTADHLVLVNEGVVAASGPTRELTASGSTRVSARELDRLHQALAERGLTVRRDDDVLVVDAQTAAVSRVALDERVELTELTQHAGGGLEELFLRITGEEAA